MSNEGRRWAEEAVVEEVSQARAEAEAAFVVGREQQAAEVGTGGGGEYRAAGGGNKRRKQRGRRQQTGAG